MIRSIFIIFQICIPVVLCAQVKHIVRSLPFNSGEYSEYAPAPCHGGIIFCSDRKAEVITQHIDQENKPLTDIYFSQLSDNNWGDPEKFSPSITSYFHEGPATFSMKGTKVYFTRNIITNKKELKRENNLLGIYSAELKDDDWVNIIPFEHNSKQYSTGHPSLTEDGSKMFFISDMPGGYGGTDIYVCESKDGRWSKPVNLGTNVNTSGNEMFPFIDAKGNLFFSSAWHNSMGGLDIFMTRYANGEWQEAQRLPEPVNTKKDDFAYVCDTTGRKGYFSSNRNGSDDIFEFTLPVPGFNTCDSMKKNVYCFEFFQDGEIPADSLPLAYEWDFNDGTKARAASADHCFKAEGKYTVQLNIIDTITGEVFYNEASYDLEVKEHEQVFIASVDTCAPEQAIEFDGTRTKLHGFIVASYYWDFGDGVIDTGKRVTHVFPKAGLYEVKLGVTTAPDANGNYRQACAYKRVVVSNDKERAIARAPGTNEDRPKKAILPPSQPLELVFKVEVANSPDPISLDNVIFDKLKDNYTIEETYEPSKDLYSYTVGKGKTLAGAWPIYKDVRQKGYSNAQVKSFADDIVSLDQLGSISQKDAGRKTVRINNALFDPGKHDLTNDARIEMDKLYRIMSGTPGIHAFISAHTDNEGSEEANSLLSDKRANAIVDYLASRGISRERLEAKGYGESMPIADNSTPEGRKLNRRVEVKIQWK